MRRNPYGWQVYTSDPDQDRKRQLLEEMGLSRLGDMTWREQADVFDGAPAEIILQHLPALVHEAQVRVWREYLPVKAREEARSLLKPEAAIALRLKKKRRRPSLLC